MEVMVKTNWRESYRSSDPDATSS